MGHTFILSIWIFSIVVQLSYGIGVYDSDHEVCCRGEVYPQSFGEATACCGNKSFDASKSICCEDENSGPVTIIPIPLNLRIGEVQPGSYKCCGKGAYDTQTQTCCNGTPMDKLFHNSGCCGQKVFDEDIFECYHNEPVLRRSVARKGGTASSRCGAQNYDERRYLCCEGKLHRKWGPTAACCRTEAFDNGQEGCCGGSVYSDPFGIFGCCGSRTYDVLSEICCNDVVSSDPFNLKTCCGTNAYFVNNHTCFDGHVIPSNAENDSSSSNSSCYHSPTFDPSRTMCCNGSVVSVPPTDINDGFFACCGNGIYNQETEICCGDRVHPRKSSKIGCCGSETYEKGREVCCGDTVLSRSISVAKDSVKKCCNGKVVDVPKHKQLCC